MSKKQEILAIGMNRFEASLLNGWINNIDLFIVHQFENDMLALSISISRKFQLIVIRVTNENSKDTIALVKLIRFLKVFDQTIVICMFDEGRMNPPEKIYDFIKVGASPFYFLISPNNKLKFTGVRDKQKHVSPNVFAKTISDYIHNQGLSSSISKFRKSLDEMDLFSNLNVMAEIMSSIVANLYSMQEILNNSIITGASSNIETKNEPMISISNLESSINTSYRLIFEQYSNFFNNFENVLQGFLSMHPKVHEVPLDTFTIIEKEFNNCKLKNSFYEKITLNINYSRNSLYVEHFMRNFSSFIFDILTYIITYGLSNMSVLVNISKIQEDNIILEFSCQASDNYEKSALSESEIAKRDSVERAIQEGVSAIIQDRPIPSMSVTFISSQDSHLPCVQLSMPHAILFDWFQNLNIGIDILERTITIEGVVVPLTWTEFKVFYAIALHSPQLATFSKLNALVNNTRHRKKSQITNAFQKHITSIHETIATELKKMELN